MLKTKFEPLGFQIDIIPTLQAGKSHLIARDGAWIHSGASSRTARCRCGAIDFKGGVAVFAETVLSEADEEGRTYNTRWLAAI